MNILNTPLSERPRERCLKCGPDSLSLGECLALILNSGPPGIGARGVAASLLEKPGHGLPPSEEERAFFTAMEVSSSAHLKGIPGLGEASQARLLAAFEVGRRYACYRMGSNRHPAGTRRRRPFSQPGSLRESSLCAISQELRNEPQEWLGFIPWHRDGRLGELCIVERGARTQVQVDPAELFARILALRPRGFILAHNHPSGDATPSEADLELTRRVGEVSGKLGVRLVGHWVLTPQSEKWIAVV